MSVKPPWVIEMERRCRREQWEKWFDFYAGPGAPFTYAIMFALLFVGLLLWEWMR